MPRLTASAATSRTVQIIAYQQQAIDSARATNGTSAAPIADHTPVADCPSGGKLYASGHALATCPAGSPCTLSTFLRVETKAGALPDELCAFPGQLVTEMSFVIEASGDDSGYALTMDSGVSLFHLDGHLYDVGSCLGTLTASEPGARLAGSLCFAVDQPL